jgi:hypothetical protein
MAVMDVVDMISVLDRLVAAVGTVLVFGDRVMHFMLIGCSHDSFSSSADQAETILQTAREVARRVTLPSELKSAPRACPGLPSVFEEGGSEQQVQRIGDAGVGDGDALLSAFATLRNPDSGHWPSAMTT